jgi:hypothetical protein
MAGKPSEAEDERRAAARRAMLLLVTIRYDDLEPSVNSRVLDISRGGLRTTLPVALKRGHPVKLVLKGIGEVRAKVAWSRKGEVGMKFDKPISLETVVQALTGAPAASHIQFSKTAVPRPGFNMR